jgi:hypothetical protein
VYEVLSGRQYYKDVVHLRCDEGEGDDQRPNNDAADLCNQRLVLRGVVGTLPIHSLQLSREVERICARKWKVNDWLGGGVKVGSLTTSSGDYQHGPV